MPKMSCLRAALLCIGLALGTHPAGAAKKAPAAPPAPPPPLIEQLRPQAERLIGAALASDHAYLRLSELCDGIGHRFDESTGEAARYGGAKGIAEPRCILGRGHPGLPGDPYRDRPVFGFQRSQQCVGVNPADR